MRLGDICGQASRLMCDPVDYGIEIGRQSSEAIYIPLTQTLAQFKVLLVLVCM